MGGDTVRRGSKSHLAQAQKRPPQQCNRINHLQPGRGAVRRGSRHNKATEITDTIPGG